MGEKRFVVKELNFEDTVIEDTVTKEQYNEYGVVDVLNEQQVTIIKLQDTLFAKEKTIDRLENTLLHLTEADGYLEKNRKITELADIGYNVKMVLSNDKEQLAKVINEQQATIRKLQDLCGQSDGENAKLRIENEQLRKELDTFKPVMFQDVRKGTVILYSKGDSDE